MTHEVYTRSAHPQAVNGTISSFLDCTRTLSGLADIVLFHPESTEPYDDEQYAPLATTTMSDHGLFEQQYSPSHRLSGGWIVQDDASEKGMVGRAMQVEEGAMKPSMRQEESATNAPVQTPRSVSTSERQTIYDESYMEHRPKKRARVSFYDFAAQTRLQQHHEHRKRFLSTRKQALQRSIALSARLRRTSSWVQDGLVEISKHQDPAGFARVFSHAQDLVDVCYSHWNNELQSIDTLQASQSTITQSTSPLPFFGQLVPEAQKELLDLLSNLRSNPLFLVERLSSLPLSQVAILTGKPKWEASESLLASLSQNSGGSAQRRRRVQAFSKELEDYATSFERSDPLSFLLHNLYGHDTSPEAPESQLRLSTWSTVCAELLHSGSKSYNSLYWQVLEAFSAMQDWPAKTRIELFLMDVLQRGAFLINDNASPRTRLGQDALNTVQAHQFLESAVSDLYWTLIECSVGCYPTGALALAQAILGKLPDERHQADFRIDFFQKWFLNHFLKAAIMFPENENMLLKIHVSRRAREYILAPLFTRFVAKFEHFMDQEYVCLPTVTCVANSSQHRGEREYSEHNTGHDKHARWPACDEPLSECRLRNHFSVCNVNYAGARTLRL